jgi:hypothetical protein
LTQRAFVSKAALSLGSVTVTLQRVRDARSIVPTTQEALPSRFLRTM